MPNLFQFKILLELYGVMGYDILFEENPLRMTKEEASELGRASESFSPALRARVTLMLAILGKDTKEEPPPTRPSPLADH